MKINVTKAVIQLWETKSKMNICARVCTSLGMMSILLFFIILVSVLFLHSILAMALPPLGLD